MVRPHLEYGAPIWNPHTKKQITLVENVQRRATKQIAGMKHLSYKERLQKLTLPTLCYRRYRGDMIEMYKLSHRYYDEGATRGFIEFRASHTRNYSMRGHKFNVFKHSFKCRVNDQWNNLPEEIVDAPSLNSFKNKLDKLWKQNEIMFDPEIDLYVITSSRGTRFANI